MAKKTKLLEARFKKGFSQDQMADMLGMTQSNYSRKKNGISRISKHEWNRLSKTLDVSVDDIFEDENNPSSVLQDYSIGNYSSIGNTYSIPQHIQQLLDTQRKYIEKLEKEIEDLKLQK